MEEESPYVTEYKNDTACSKDIEGGKISLNEDPTLRYIVYAVLIFVIIMVLYNAYCSFCENRDSGFLNSGVRDDTENDDEYIEKQIKLLKRLQKNNLAEM